MKNTLMFLLVLALMMAGAAPSMARQLPWATNLILNSSQDEVSETIPYFTSEPQQAPPVNIEIDFGTKIVDLGNTESVTVIGWVDQGSYWSEPNSEIGGEYHWRYGLDDYNPPGGDCGMYWDPNNLPDGSCRAQMQVYIRNPD